MLTDPPGLHGFRRWRRPGDPRPCCLPAGPGLLLGWVSTELVSQGAGSCPAQLAAFQVRHPPPPTYDRTRMHAARSAMPPGETGGCGQTHPAFPNEHSRPRRRTFRKALAKQPCTGPGTRGWSAAGQWASVSCRSGQRRSAGTGSPLTARIREQCSGCLRGIRAQGRGVLAQTGIGTQGKGSPLTARYGAQD